MKVADRSHERLEELIAADSLDGLDPSEQILLRSEMAQHGPDCAECRRLVAEYAEIAARLAVALDPAPLSAEAEERLLAAARRGRPAAPRTPRAARAAGPGRVRRFVGGLAAAAVIAAVAGTVGYAIAPRGQPVPVAFAEFVASGTTRVAPLAGEPGQRLALAYHPGEQKAWVVGAGLPSPPSNRVYELWYAVGAGPMRPAGLFVPSEGAVLAPVTIGSSFDVLAVSVEPEGGSDTPSGTPVFVSS